MWLFAVSNEIRSTVLSEHPELSGQFIDLNLSNYEITSEVEENLDLLVENQRIDVPDEVGWLPTLRDGDCPWHPPLM